MSEQEPSAQMLASTANWIAAVRAREHARPDRLFDDPWAAGLGTMEDPVAFLAERGWHATLSQAGQPEANHGRWTLPVIPTAMPNMPHNWFVTAQKPHSLWFIPCF